MAEITSLMDLLNDMSDEHTEALFEVLVDLDPLAVEEGKPKYTPTQRQVLVDAKQAYADAGYTSD